MLIPPGDSLRRDPRMKERKKTNMLGARKAVSPAISSFRIDSDAP
jgi:ribosomal protein S9